LSWSPIDAKSYSVRYGFLFFFEILDFNSVSRKDSQMFLIHFLLLRLDRIDDLIRGRILIWRFLLFQYWMLSPSYSVCRFRKFWVWSLRLVVSSLFIVVMNPLTVVIIFPLIIFFLSTPINWRSGHRYLSNCRKCLRSYKRSFVFQLRWGNSILICSCECYWDILIHTGLVFWWVIRCWWWRSSRRAPTFWYFCHDIHTLDSLSL